MEDLEKLIKNSMEKAEESREAIFTLWLHPRVQKLVSTYAYRYQSSSDVSVSEDDLKQEMTERFLIGISNLSDLRGFWTYTSLILRSACVDYIKKEKKGKKTPKREKTEKDYEYLVKRLVSVEDIEDPEASIEDSAVVSELFRKVIEHLPNLSPEQHGVFVTYCLVGYNLSEVERLMGITRKEAQERLNEALAYILAQLE